MWKFNGIEVIELEGMGIGFVYKITNNISGRIYIGKKLAQFSKTKTKTITLKSGVKKKKKIKSKIESDWRTYYGSSVELSKDVNELGTDNFTREILCFCKSKGTLSYMEAKIQFQLEVLEKPDQFYNGHIQVRVHRSTLKF